MTGSVVHDKSSTWERRWWQGLFLSLALWSCFAWSASSQLQQCQMDQQEGPQGSRVTRLQAAPLAHMSQVAKEGPLAEGTQVCEARLRRAQHRLETIIARQETTTGSEEEGTEEGEVPAQATLSHNGASKEIEEAVQKAREAYMLKAMHGDILALRGTLAKMKATFDADWATMLEGQPDRGIFMLTGPVAGHVYTVNAFVNLWVVRHHFKSTLPVVIM